MIRMEKLFKECGFENYTLPKDDEIGVMFYPYPLWDVRTIQELYNYFKMHLPAGARSMGFPSMASLCNLTLDEVISIRDSLNVVIEQWDSKEVEKNGIDSETGAGLKDSSGTF